MVLSLSLGYFDSTEAADPRKHQAAFQVSGSRSLATVHYPVDVFKF